MRLNPSVPAFLIDAGLELSTPILLGSTGLGIYGFRGLLGMRYVASRQQIGLADTDPWWQYYKKKVAPDNKEGIQVSKFKQTAGFSLGAGVSLATSFDAGNTFSSKIFFLLSLPEVFLLQGQGQVLKQRIGLDTTQDPPFFALISISSTAVEAAFGVNYKIPDEGGQQGKIATLDGVLEMGYFFASSSAWYLNIGKDMPENRRIQTRLLTVFNVYFYLMLSSSGIRAGAGNAYELKKKWGPLKAELSAYLDVAGRLSRRPKQIGGSIQIGGSVELSIFGCGFGLSGDASLVAEGVKPFMIAGSLKVCVKILWKKYCGTFDFNYTFDPSLNLEEIPILPDRRGGRQGAQHAHRRDLRAVDRQRAAGAGRARAGDGADGQLHRPRAGQKRQGGAGGVGPLRRQSPGLEVRRVLPAAARQKRPGAPRIQPRKRRDPLPRRRQLGSLRPLRRGHAAPAGALRHHRPVDPRPTATGRTRSPASSASCASWPPRRSATSRRAPATWCRKTSASPSRRSSARRRGPKRPACRSTASGPNEPAPIPLERDRFYFYQLFRFRVRGGDGEIVCGRRRRRSGRSRPARRVDRALFPRGLSRHHPAPRGLLRDRRGLLLRTGAGAFAGGAPRPAAFPLPAGQKQAAAPGAGGSGDRIRRAPAADRQDRGHDRQLQENRAGAAATRTGSSPSCSSVSCGR